jgi:hypothetical protein
MDSAEAQRTADLVSGGIQVLDGGQHSRDEQVSLITPAINDFGSTIAISAVVGAESSIEKGSDVGFRMNLVLKISGWGCTGITGSDWFSVG